jgi:hypothetical protein
LIVIRSWLALCTIVIAFYNQTGKSAGHLGDYGQQ